MRTMLMCVAIIALLWTGSLASDAPTTAPAPAPDDRFTATLPSGIKVELIGLTSDGETWWRPDGSSLEDNPQGELRKSYGGQHPTYWVAVRLVNVPTDKDLIVWYASRNDFPMDEMPGSGRSLKPKDQIHIFQGVREEGMTTGWVRYAVSNEDWDLVAKLDHWGGFTEAGMSGVPEAGVEYVGLFDHKGDLIVHVHDSLKEDLVSVVITDKTDKEHREPWGGSQSARNKHARWYTFRGLRPDVKEVRVEAANYTWINFKGVALQPDVNASVEVEVVEAKDQ